MRHHLLYISAPSRFEQICQALNHIHANETGQKKEGEAFFTLKHRLLGELELVIYVIANIDAATAHLRLHPVDLLIYDERGEGAIPASQAIDKIKRDVRTLSDLWGPDFIFPLSRIVAVLQGDSSHAERAFELGRLNVRNVCIEPKSTAILLLWLKRILTEGIVRKSKIGMAFSGGGLEGFLYQLGCLIALEKALKGRDLRKCDVVAGVSSGAIAGAIFSTGIELQSVVDSIQGRPSDLPKLSSSTLFDLASFDIAKRVFAESLTNLSINPQKWIEKTARLIPTGFFKGDAFENYLRKAIETVGRKDTFDDLNCKLYIGATDQDTFEHVIFGAKPWDKVSISEAVRASVALPPLFTPKEINGRWFIDGQVTKTTDLELVVEAGCSLVIAVNPLKPYTSSVPGTTDKKGGLYGLIQSVKALIHTRFQSSLSHLAERYPDVDFVVFEPDEECAKAMSGSPMKYKIRSEIIQLAYECTLRRLRERHPIYSVKFERFGFELASVKNLQKLETVSVLDES